MRITRIYNNNTVEANYDGREVVVMGKGLAFGRRTGDNIPEEKIEKIFELSNNSASGFFLKMINQIPFSYWNFVIHIEQMVEENLNTKLTSGFYISLLDHLYVAVDRAKRGIVIPCYISGEVKYIYKKELGLAQKIVSMAEKEFAVSFDPSEVYFIVMHIIDTHYSSDVHMLEEIAKNVNSILDIVKTYFTLEIDESSFHYERFCTHLRFLLERLILIKQPSPEIDGITDITTDLKDKYPRQYECMSQITERLEKKLECTLTKEETFYILLYIVKVTNHE